ncbi:MAG: GTPase [Akkermansia muciniphila]
MGRPNAGKSSLVNAILRDRRTIVSNVAGTTRDAIDIPYLHDSQPYVLIDTAGMRPRSRRDTSVEVFSAMRSEKAIRRADICLLVIDIAAGITQQDRRIAGIIAEEGKPCIIIVNKFDLFHPNASRRTAWRKWKNRCAGNYSSSTTRLSSPPPPKKRKAWKSSSKSSRASAGNPITCPLPASSTA